MANSAPMTRLAAIFAAFFTLMAPAFGADAPVTVFAAASLRGALDEVATDYPAPVRLSFGGSGAMARQAAAGAPADMVILANRLWTGWLMKQGLAQEATPIASNALVVIATAGTAPFTDANDLVAKLGTSRLAMGQRDAVPAGRYARQWLEATDLWPNVSDRLAETDNVRAALALVARGEATFGVVYATDAQAEPRVITVWDIATNHHDPILYSAIALTPAGDDFLSHLTRPAAARIFAAHGFGPATQ